MEKAFDSLAIQKTLYALNIIPIDLLFSFPEHGATQCSINNILKYL